MSLDALYWVATTPLDLPTSQQVGREWCHRVLINLVAHANAAGETFVSDRQQAEELGRDRRDVRAARDLLRAAGVERYTGKNKGRSKVYALDLPGYDWAEMSTPSAKGRLSQAAKKADDQAPDHAENDPEHGRGNGRGNGRGHGRDTPPLREEKRNTPLPPKTNTTHRRDKSPGGVASESENLTGLVLAQAVARERSTYERQYPGREIGLGLVKSWRREYAPYVAQVVAQAGEVDPDDRQALDRLAQAAKSLATGGTTQVGTAPAARRVKTCPTCGNKNRDDQGRTTIPDTSAPRDPERRGVPYVVCPDCHGSGGQEISAVA